MNPFYLQRNKGTRHAFISEKSYDFVGNALTYLWVKDTNGDNITDSTSYTTNTYDTNGNILVGLNEIDSNGDGVIDRRTRTERTYDSNNMLFTYLQERDDNGDGIYEDKSGDLLTTEFGTCDNE